MPSPGRRSPCALGYPLKLKTLALPLGAPSPWGTGGLTGQLWRQVASASAGTCPVWRAAAGWTPKLTQGEEEEEAQ